MNQFLCGQSRIRVPKELKVIEQEIERVLENELYKAEDGITFD